MSALCRVLLGLLPAEEDRISAVLYGGGAIVTVGSGADANELTALTATTPADLALLSPNLPGLDRSQVQQLRSSGLRVVGFAVDETTVGRLEQLGVDATLTLPIAAADLEELVTDSALEPVHAPKVASPAVAARDVVVAREGSVLAVVGSRGAPGSSELAASFAAVVSGQWRALLCEIDRDGGQLALRLGVDPREGSILGPLRALHSPANAVGEMLAHWVVEPGRGWPTVLVSPFDPGDLGDSISPGGVHRLLSVLTAGFPMVICDLGHRMGTGARLDSATRLHRDVITAADGVVVVIGTRPEQARAGLAQVELLLNDLAVTPDRLRVVVNGQPGGGPSRSGETAALINGELPALGLAVDAWLPYDEKSFQAASRRGQPLAVARPRGAYAQAVRELAAAVLLPGVPQPAARKRRLGAPATAAATAGSVEEVRLPWRR